MRHYLSDNAMVFQRLDRIELKQLEADEKFKKIFSQLEQPDAGGGGAKKWSCSSQPCHSSEVCPKIDCRLVFTSVGNRRSCRCCP